MIKLSGILTLAMIMAGPSMALAQDASNSAPAAASEDVPVLTSAQQVRAQEMVMNVVQFAVLHEMGHMMVGELDLPVLGFSEDAADSFAIQILLKTFPDDANDTLRDTMRSWFLMQQSDNTDTDPDDESAYYDEHSLSVQRGYAILCQLVGSSQERYAALATSYGMDDTRQQSCNFDYSLAEDGWTQLLVPHSIGADAAPATGDAAAPASTPADADASDPDADPDPAIPLTVSYEDDDDAALKTAEQMLKDSGILESSAASINQSYVMPREIGINARSCEDGPNLDYNEDDAEIEVCYEFLGMISDLVITDIAANPDQYTDAVGPVAIPVTADFMDDMWIVKGVEADPAQSVSTVVADDPRYLNAWIAFSPDAIIWTKAGATGSIDPSIDTCMAPVFADTPQGEFYDITCGTGNDVWGSVAAIDDDNVKLRWRDGALLTLTKTEGYTADETVFGYVEQSSILTTLVTALGLAGDSTMLDGAGPVTILAPADNAFRALPPGMLDDLMQPANIDALKALVGCHIIDRSFSTDEVPSSGEPLKVTTIGGCELSFAYPADGGLTVTDENGIAATFVYQDIGEANGTVHVIDAVMTPKAD